MTRDKATDPLNRISELITLQGRVINTLAAQGQIVERAQGQAQQAIRLAVDKLVRLDGSPAVFGALTAAAWDAVGPGELTALLKDTAARVALAQLQKQSGTYDDVMAASRKGTAKDHELRQELEKLEKEYETLDKRLVDVNEYNAQRNVVPLDERQEKRFRESGFWSRANFSPDLSRTYSQYSKYNSKYSGQYHTANFFDDLKQHRKLAEAVKATNEAIKKLHDTQLSHAAVLRDYARLHQDIRGNAGQPPEYNKLCDLLCEKLADENFVTAFSRHLPSALGGPVILAAVKTETLSAICERMKTLLVDAQNTLEVLEGPVQERARSNTRINAVEMAEDDARVLAALAGYMCLSAAAAVNAVETFLPDHTEGALSLRRELQMYMAVAGKVDPAFICETTGMDRLTAGYFKVDPLAVKPDFIPVLADTAAVARIDRRYAAFLSDIAGSDELQGVSFGNVRLDSAAFNAIMEQTKPDLTATQREFAKLARLSKDVIEEAARPALPKEQATETEDPRPRRRDRGGPAPK